MSLIGEKVALISVGMSCQTVHQIESAIDVAHEVTGDRTLESKGLPFDWMICPPASACSILDDNEFFPSSVDELRSLPLEVVHERPPTIPGWPKRNAFFWHEFMALDSSLAEQFADTQEKFHHLSRTFLSLKSREVFAFVSNTQCNFDMIERVTGVGANVRASSLNRLKASLDRALQRPVALCLVANQDTYTRDAEPHFQEFFVKQKVEHWSGEESAWRPVIRQFLSNHFLLPKR